VTAEQPDLAALRALETAATPGPWDAWHVLEDGRAEMYVPNGTMSTETIFEFKDFIDCEECARPNAEDIALIAAMRNALPALLAYVERTAERDAARAEVAALRDGITSDEAIERAAREAFWTDDMGGRHKPGRQPHTWENIPEAGRENYRTLVRAVARALLDRDAPEPSPGTP